MLTALERSSAVVIKAPTGAGKTTRVPPALLGADWLGGDRVIVLEPRRIAARAAARRIAQERGGEVGGEVGYQIRFERRISRETRVVVVTEGILVRMLQDDPFLEGVGAVVLDEFHERSIHTDLALAMSYRVQREVRPELRLVVMSATLEPERIARYLGDCPIVVSQGRTYPVEVSYLERADKRYPDELAASGVRRAAEIDQGDILTFLPGVPEIRRAAEHLEAWSRARDIAVLPLYGDLPSHKQDAVLQPGPRRRVVLATNVAETSITIDGISTVVDTGLAKVMRFNPDTGLNRLELTRISVASADQRAGRAGRTGPGRCLRMWTELEHRHLSAQELPEIQRIDLTGPALELLAWGESDLSQFDWFEPPDEAALEQALELLRLLGAVDDSGVTAIGRQMVALPVHPRLARLALEGARRGFPKEAALCAAILSERDPFGRRFDQREAPTGRSRSDVLDRLDALIAHEARQPLPGRVRLNRAAARFILKSRDQLARRLKEGPRSSNRQRALLRAVLAGYPDRVAKRRQAGSRRALMVGGKGVELAPESALLDPELFVCVELRDGPRAEAYVRMASAVEEGWLDEERVTSSIDLEFDRALERVTAMRRTRYGDLVLSEVNAQPDDPAAVSRVLAAAAREDLVHALELDRPNIAGLLMRIRFLAEAMPELKIPRMEESDWEGLLSTLCYGRRSFAELRQQPLTEIIRGTMGHAQWSTLEQEAPERLEVPSGSRIRLQYRESGPPVLAVRIQEMYGLAQTPRLAGQRVPVLLHLLAPNMRPQQITDDLESFWANTYPEVRKELRQRYPKHAWPEDPLTARPEKRPRRKRR